MKYKIFIAAFFFCSFLIKEVKSQNYTYGNTEINLNSFTHPNAQWIAVNPLNNTLGTNYYQGLNFGFDSNNFSVLTNPVGTNDLYFGRWAWSWQGYVKIWHSGNLNNSNTDFTAKQLNSSKIALNVPGSSQPIDAMTIDVGSFGTSGNAANSNFFRVRDIGAGNEVKFIIRGDGNVGVGVQNPIYKLDVKGTIHACEVVVDVANGCDFVFDQKYKLMDLKTLERYIEENKHLPEIASEKEMIENGVNMKELQMKFLQKIEELTLYTIDQQKKIEQQDKTIDSQSAKITELEKQNEKIKVLEERLLKIESALK